MPQRHRPWISATIRHSRTFAADIGGSSALMMTSRQQSCSGAHSPGHHNGTLSAMSGRPATSTIVAPAANQIA